MSHPTAKEQEILLKLARDVIIEALTGESAPPPAEATPLMKEKRGCFVTLHKDGDLRGCIGTIEPITPLEDAVRENALNSAFRDPRFPPLKEEELSKIHIEISVLTRPEILEYKGGEDLKAKLKPGVHGVILSKGWRQSTFLPQVWEQLPETESFLTHLCQKGQMGSDCWKDPDTVVKTYEAFYFEE